MSRIGTILVVDDDDDILTAARLLLRRRFADVITCRRPDRIPELMQRHAFDVVLLREIGARPGFRDRRWRRRRRGFGGGWRLHPAPVQPAAATDRRQEFALA